MRSFYTHFLWLVMLLSIPVSSVSAQRFTIEDLAPALDAQSVAILGIDLQNVRLTDLYDQIVCIERQTASPEWKPWITKLQSAIEQLRESGGVELAVMYRIGPLTEMNRLVAVKCKNESSAKLVAELIKKNNPIKRNARVETLGSVVFTGVYESSKSEWIKEVANPPEWKLMRTESELDTLRTAWKSMKDAPIKIAVSLTPDQRRALDEFGSQTDPLRQLQTQMHWMAISLDPSQNRVHWTVMMEKLSPTKPVSDELELLTGLTRWKQTESERAPQLTSIANDDQYLKVLRRFAGSVPSKSATTSNGNHPDRDESAGQGTYQIPEYWFQDLFPSLWIVSGLAG